MSATVIYRAPGHRTETPATVTGPCVCTTCGPSGTFNAIRRSVLRLAGGEVVDHVHSSDMTPLGVDRWASRGSVIR